MKTAVEGHAWQADHIVPVYRGGGRCGLENLRTLCTPCHADVTKQQAKDRAAARCARVAIRVPQLFPDTGRESGFTNTVPSWNKSTRSSPAVKFSLLVNVSQMAPCGCCDWSAVVAASWVPAQYPRVLVLRASAELWQRGSKQCSTPSQGAEGSGLPGPLHEGTEAHHGAQAREEAQSEGCGDQDGATNGSNADLGPSRHQSRPAGARDTAQQFGGRHFGARPVRACGGD